MEWMPLPNPPNEREQAAGLRHRRRQNTGALRTKNMEIPWFGKTEAERRFVQELMTLCKKHDVYIGYKEMNGPHAFRSHVTQYDGWPSGWSNRPIDIDMREVAKAVSDLERFRKACDKGFYLTAENKLT